MICLGINQLSKYASLSINSNLHYLFCINRTDAPNMKPTKNTYKLRKIYSKPNLNLEFMSFIILHLPYSYTNCISNPINYSNCEYKDNRTIKNGRQVPLVITKIKIEIKTIYVI